MSSIDASSTPPSSDQDENRPDRKAEKVEGTEGGATLSSSYPPVLENDRPLPDQNTGGAGKDIGANFGLDDGNEVRAPLPVKRDVLYDHAVLYGASRMGYPSHEAHSVVPFRNFDEEMKRSGIWESEQGGTSTTDNSRDNLASLYRPPFALMHLGPFEKAKDAAKVQNKWLLVNLQSTIEFSSHMLNRDTWANEAVAQTISSNFIFWQVYDDTEEGRKVCTYYKLESIPVILVIDPITGQKMRSWRGMILPESLLEDLLPFMDGNPSDHHFSLSHKRPRGSSQTPHKTPESPVGANETNEEEDEELLLALAVSMESMKDTSGVTFKDEDVDKEIINEDKEEEKLSTKKFTYPPLPEEPQGDRTLLCRVGVRLPDGRRLQRNFLRSDPIKLMWSFCYSKLEEGELRQLRLTQAIPGASKLLDYDSNLTFENSGLANSMISVTWE